MSCLLVFVYCCAVPLISHSFEICHICICVCIWLCFTCVSVCEQACRDSWRFSCALQSFAPRLTWVVWTARRLWAAQREWTLCPSAAATVSSITALRHSTSLILMCGPSLTCSMWRYVMPINNKVSVCSSHKCVYDFRRPNIAHEL